MFFYQKSILIEILLWYYKLINSYFNQYLINMTTLDNSILGESLAFQQILDQASKIANLSKPVLLIGERGTGKEVIASRIHYLSERWEKPFIKLNCATLSESLLETELFGHEAGSFTGAVKRHIGRFEMAHQGTLFLDELATTSLRLQEKLLRVIEYGEFERVGGSETLSTNVRIIAATNVDLPTISQQGKFRADLLDRLAFAVITLPPLRARDEDILVLAEYFAVAMARELNWAFFPGFSESIKQALLDYPWPGNIRELKNCIERAVFNWPTPTKSINHIEFDPFASPYRPQSLNPTEHPLSKNKKNPFSYLEDFHKQSMTLKDYLKNLEQQLIQQALQNNQFHQRKTAKALGITYHQLRALLRKYSM